MCTPEKWDIITRKSGERTYTQLVSLVIIVSGEEGRGRKKGVKTEGRREKYVFSTCVRKWEAGGGRREENL